MRKVSLNESERKLVVAALLEFLDNRDEHICVWHGRPDAEDVLWYFLNAKSVVITHN